MSQNQGLIRTDNSIHRVLTISIDKQSAESALRRQYPMASMELAWRRHGIHGIAES